MALFRFLFAPALLAVAVLAGHGERRRSPPPVPATVVPAPPAAPQRAVIGPAAPRGPGGDSRARRPASPR